MLAHTYIGEKKEKQIKKVLLEEEKGEKIYNTEYFVGP